jgi:hypothetical protein
MPYATALMTIGHASAFVIDAMKVCPSILVFF